MSDYSTDSDATSVASSVLEEVTQVLFEHLRNSTYACGGTIKTRQSASETTDDQAAVLADPVTIRWDSAKSIEKLTLPLSKEKAARKQSSVTRLAAGTQPASFGFQGRDVIDESYRKASKLDTSAFSTNFCPYEAGIIDVIAQALLPKFPYSSQGIFAELYKLNIYQAPSGFFRAHVDTPRSELQFGSLVVCLPCDHQGGQLIVRHQDQETRFDWSGHAQNIQWAAFYSDCEHEVLEVTSGHRVTLTYNLYMRRGLGELAGHSEVLDAQQLSVFKELKDALASHDFMAKGGLIGKYCDHAYAHTTTDAATKFPSILKGADMVAYEVFRSLGIKILIRPIAEHVSQYENYDISAKLRRRDFVGNAITECIETGMEWGECENGYDVWNQYPSTLQKVHWINAPTPGTEDIQFSYTRYGNQAEAAFAYSHCALLFVIPPFETRVKIAPKQTDAPA
ncbi:hypothetical protein BDU57DRAFT_483512 [Ampelomyces quisqualis]|uniref:Fe2OG dioxygenase domain-containing protein n=1 Tax=Ampelomyces quisqualis TaxID=50730 RepID=A0A6A5QB05_AMPQU|nr:hypothetical protein BDU57DRAFT_483512 [Ampelomyces quisqualis]